MQVIALHLKGTLKVELILTVKTDIGKIAYPLARWWFSIISTEKNCLDLGAFKVSL